MSAEPTQTTNADGWTGWQGQVVQGRFVLRRCLGWSEHGAVFLTEHKAKNLAEAAIKFVRADAPQAQPLLVQWQAAVNLSHPHLVPLFEVGRWQSEGQDYLFVVMESADQTLAEILRRRALSAEELQELLPPVLEALTFLHRRQLVHGQLKPSNFMAVGDQLKLASDTIRPAGQAHGTSTADDVWDLGATLVEAITARARIPRDQRFDVASLPAGLPATLVETVRRCLSPTPADRPSIIELRAENKSAPPAPGLVAKPEPSIQKGSPVAVAAQQVPPQPASREVVPAQPVPSTARGVASPRPADPAPRVAASSQSVPSASREVAQSQPANIASRVAASSQPVPSPPREAPPLQPLQTASRVTVSFHAVPSTPREAAQSQPAPSASKEIAAPKPAPSIPQAVASPRPADIASRGVAPTQSSPSTPREALSPQPAQIVSRLAVSFQPVSSTPRDGAAPQAARIASREAAPAQPAPKTSHEAAQPRAAHTAWRAAATSEPVPSTTREVAPAQRAPSPSREATPLQPTPITSREITPPQPVPTTAREITPPQPAPNKSREITPPRPAANTSPGAAPSERAPKRHFLGIAAGALLLVIAVWITLRSTDDSPAPLQRAAVPAPTPLAPSAPANLATSEPPVSAPVPQPQAQPAPTTTSSSVLHEVTPTVPEKIQNKIQGHVYVTVRVLVAPAGNVIGVLMENPGPSKYFARISDEAAREWQFVPADTDAARVWLLRYEYTRDGVSVRTFEQ